jgi:pimeloyl-ACP methyl ester carboxylesterase
VAPFAGSTEGYAGRVPSLAVDGATLHYEDVGSGEPLVLLHGAAASAVSVEPLLAGFRDRYRVIAPDLRGMGRSSPVEQVAPGAWVDDLVALLDALEIDAAHVLGVSLGARVGLRLALDAPRRVRTLVLDAPILEDSPAGTAALERIFRDDVPPELAAGFERWNGPEWRAAVDRYLRLRLSPGLQEHYALRARLGEIAAPTLVTRGDVDDPIHPVAHAVEAHERIAGSWLWISPATPFSATRFRPDDAIVEVERFLAST